MFPDCSFVVLKKGVGSSVLEAVDECIHLLRLDPLKRIADAHVEDKTAVRRL